MMKKRLLSLLLALTLAVAAIPFVSLPRAEAAGNEAEAVKYRKKGAFLFDPFAMLGLARHYEHAGDGKQAAEWYALAASFDNAEGEARYADLTGLSLDRKEKRRLRKDFIYGRRFSLRD